MEMMGSKTRARQEMEKAGVPFVPGLRAGWSPSQQATEVADEIGYPVMLKAAAGGGGKGMRAGRMTPQNSRPRWKRQSEAQRAFGDGEVYSRRRSSIRGTSRCRCWRTSTATRVPRRARVLHSAAAPESAGRGAVAAGRCRTCGGAWARSPCEWPKRQGTQRRNGRVSGRSDEEFLFPGDEHAPAGGASGDGTGHRTGPGPSADSHRRRARSLPFSRKTS